MRGRMRRLTCAKALLSSSDLSILSVSILVVGVPDRGGGASERGVDFESLFCGGGGGGGGITPKVLLLLLLLILSSSCSNDSLDFRLAAGDGGGPSAKVLSKAEANCICAFDNLLVIFSLLLSIIVVCFSDLIDLNS